jgi:hypothetical protein
MNIAQNDTIPGKPDQIQQHKVKLLPGITKEPVFILPDAPAEEFVRVFETPVHVRLMRFVGHQLMNSELVINDVYRDTELLPQRAGNRRLSGAGRT